jgi:hypothetical protein
MYFFIAASPGYGGNNYGYGGGNNGRMRASTPDHY